MPRDGGAWLVAPMKSLPDLKSPRKGSTLPAGTLTAVLASNAQRVLKGDRDGDEQPVRLLRELSFSAREGRVIPRPCRGMTRPRPKLFHFTPEPWRDTNTSGRGISGGLGG